MKPMTLLVILLLLFVETRPQSGVLKSTLYKLENQIIAGDMSSLKKMATYLDDKTFVQEYLGYHNHPNSARGIAIRVLQENCLFDSTEHVFDSLISTQKFMNFLSSNPVRFDVLTGRYVIKDATQRQTSYELKKLSPEEVVSIDSAVIKFPFPDWYYENQIDWFLKKNDNQALLWIASAWYNKRARFNRYYFADHEFLNLMKSLTHLDVSVPDEYGKMNSLFNIDYLANAKLNYLIYWSNHYKDYRWDDKPGYFINVKETPGDKSEEEKLFARLVLKDDSLALSAFAKLSEMDTAKVKTLADQYQGLDLDRNDALPTFPFRFLKQMVLFTQYCRDNGIDYKPTGWLADSLTLLKQRLSFPDRYRLENNIVQQLEIEQVGIIEYFGLINEPIWDATYSIGRILDKFYSAKWKELTENEKDLAFYLKKSRLFDNLGIIGTCKKYLQKFKNCSSSALTAVNNLASVSKDFDIRQQAQKVITRYSKGSPPLNSAYKKWEGHNELYGVPTLVSKYRKLNLTGTKETEINFQRNQLLSNISYLEIGQAIQLVEQDTSWKEDEKLSFIKYDFGLDIYAPQFSGVQGFLTAYNSMTEQQVYLLYARNTGTNCIDGKGELIYPAVYDLLKYGVVDAFAGGGGSRRENGVYPVIKLLEFTFNTTLGFPKKRCNWQGMYNCECSTQAMAWMHFLESRQLIEKDNFGPDSISRNE